MSLLIFGSLFVVSVGAMFSLLLRRLPALRAADGETAEEVLSASVVRTYVVAWIDYGEAWYRGRAKEQFLKLLDTLLHAFEKAAGRVAGETKHVRLMVQERFRVIPRESLYWK
ncbi:MAG: hypothetical protein HY470_01900, partial [Candidatus Ryanbacteria bacterium]|nr:hypothetical protein [Candidatus Ryanbacteria bacterium]